MRTKVRQPGVIDLWELSLPICRTGCEEHLPLLQLSRGLETGAAAWEALEQDLDSVMTVGAHPMSAILLLLPVTSALETRFRT